MKKFSKILILILSLTLAFAIGGCVAETTTSSELSSTSSSREQSSISSQESSSKESQTTLPSISSSQSS